MGAKSRLGLPELTGNRGQIRPQDGPGASGSTLQPLTGRHTDTRVADKMSSK